jgi:hypothetical protein
MLPVTMIRASALEFAEPARHKEPRFLSQRVVNGATPCNPVVGIVKLFFRSDARRSRRKGPVAGGHRAVYFTGKREHAPLCRMRPDSGGTFPGRADPRATSCARLWAPRAQDRSVRHVARKRLSWSFGHFDGPPAAVRAQRAAVYPPVYPFHIPRAKPISQNMGKP